MAVLLNPHLQIASHSVQSDLKRLHVIRMDASRIWVMNASHGTSYQCNSFIVICFSNRTAKIKGQVDTLAIAIFTQNNRRNGLILPTLLGFSLFMDRCRHPARHKRVAEDLYMVGSCADMKKSGAVDKIRIQFPPPAKPLPANITPPDTGYALDGTLAALISGQSIRLEVQRRDNPGTGIYTLAQFVPDLEVQRLIVNKDSMNICYL